MTPAQEFVYLRTYSRWLPEEQRRETYPETVKRFTSFMDDELGCIPSSDIARATSALLNFDAVPSMRALWAAGPAAKDNNITIFNCSYLTVSSIRAFAETLFILMCGTGVGFSVEKQFVDQLPEIKPRTGTTVHIDVEDSKLGWAEALDTLLSELWQGNDVSVTYDKVRPRGARLLTMGGRASGPEPLRDLFEFCKRMFADKRAKKQKKLQPIDCLDIENKIAEIVVVGGVRRSSEIGLSDLDDRAIAEAKMGEFWNQNPHRAMSNNSAVYPGKPDTLTFLQEFMTLIKSKAGERGIFNREAAIRQMTASGRRKPWFNVGTNPCVPGWVNILTKQGYQPIELLVGKKVDVWNGFEWSEVEPRVTGHDQPVVDVLLSSGQSLTCTHYHEFVIAEDYHGTTKRVKAKDLEPGMKLMKHEYPVVDGGDTVTYAYSQGFVSAEGMDGYSHVAVYEPKFPCISRLNGKAGKPSKDGSRVYVWLSFTPHSKEFVPLGWSVQSRLDWLAGLLDGDGCVLPEGGIQLTSVNLDFLLNVQKMLTTLGTPSKVIHRRDGGFKDMPDGRGGKKSYYCQPVYMLGIGSAEMQDLVALGLSCSRLKLGHSPNRSASRFVTVVDVVDAGVVDTVYCFTEPLRHTGCFEGVVTGQCGEIILRDCELCNLSEVVVRASDTLESLRRKVKIAAMFGAWQATFTKFPYLRPDWAKNCNEERLLGVSLTGIMDNHVLNNVNDKMKKWLGELKATAISETERWCKRLGINMSAAVTCVKPSGTTSQFVDCSSGIHQRFSQHYIRRYRISATDPLFRLMQDQGVPAFPENGQDPSSASTYVLEFPIAAPVGAKTRHDFTAMQQLEHWRVVKDFWCEHNPSITVYVGEDEWVQTAAWVYDNFNDICGVSFLPKSDHIYNLAPYEEITQDEYKASVEAFPKLDYSKLSQYEQEDNTVGAKSYACMGDRCELV